MAEETFVVTVLSFALVVAVIAALLLWVVLPAIRDDGTDEEGSKKSKKLTMSDYIDRINAINRSAYNYDLAQQDDIDKNREDIEENRDDIHELQSNFSRLSTTQAPHPAGVPTSSAASAQFSGGTWTISQGGFEYKALPYQVCMGGTCFDIGSG